MTGPALLIDDGFVYTADAHDTVHPSGSVLIIGDRIAEVGPTAVVAEAVQRLPLSVAAGLQIIDARRMMVLPGLVNPHWHEMFALRVPFRGALRPPHDAADEPGLMANGGDIPRISAAFDSFAALPAGLTTGEADAVARYSLWTQLRSGVTAVGDTGSLNRPDRIAEAARTIGLRCAVTTWASDAVCPPGERRFRRTRAADDVLGPLEDLLRRYRTVPGEPIRAWPSALYVTNMTDELGHGLGTLADRYDTPLVIHAAALRNEVEAVRRYYGSTPIRRLAELGLLGDRLLAVHCAFVDDEECKLLTAANVHVTHSPAKYGGTGESTMTETRVIPELMRAGVAVSLSTDGSVFAPAGMPEAMRAAWQMHNGLAADDTWVTPTRALAMASRVAAAGLRWDDEIGSLEVGKQADLVLIPAGDWRYALNPRPLEAFLTLGGSADVDTVVVAGRIRLRDGQSPDGDESELERDYLDALRSFSARHLDVDATALARVFDGRT